MLDERAHVVKTVVMADKKARTVTVGIKCDVCGEIMLPPIPYDHVKAFAKLLHLAGAHVGTPEFTYVPAPGGLVDTAEKLDDAIDAHNVIHEILMMSKRANRS